MAAVIDILEDVNQKFYGTIVMYDKKATLVKSVGLHPEIAGEFTLAIALPNARTLKYINLSDPLLNYQHFNIGYANCPPGATWWFRKPHKQWAQGLKQNQMGYIVGPGGNGPQENFGPSGHFNKMLENIYPTITECKQLLGSKHYSTIAFHRNFALSYDDLHEDFLLEYHGVRIGTSLDKDLKQFKIKAEASHLIQALMEARDVQN